MDDNHDPADISHWPEELQLPVSAQELSAIMVEIGLKSADLRPLAEHLRAGFPLSQTTSDIIADAIQRSATAVCKIYAEKLKEGNPHNSSNNNHEKSLNIFREYCSLRSNEKRTRWNLIRSKLAVKYEIKENEVDNIIKYVQRWIKRYE
jgi:hypothetical protein